MNKTDKYLEDSKEYIDYRTNYEDFLKKILKLVNDKNKAPKDKRISFIEKTENTNAGSNSCPICGYAIIEKPDEAFFKITISHSKNTVIKRECCMYRCSAYNLGCDFSGSIFDFVHALNLVGIIEQNKVMEERDVLNYVRVFNNTEITPKPCKP